ncbi:MAG TPA: hypothetical protein VGK21_13330 [Candidatus Angelobacter sp.]|jgi:hypothetical protein
MKLFVLLLMLFQAQQQQNILTADQVLAWRTYYGLPLDKDVSEALKVFGEPDIKNKATRQWNPSSRTGYRMVIAELGYSPSQGRNTVLRVTVYPHPSDVLNVMEFLHKPEMFIFEPGHSDKTGSSLTIETKDRQMKFLFLCAGDHDPQLQSVTIKSIKSPDADPL